MWYMCYEGRVAGGMPTLWHLNLSLMHSFLHCRHENCRDLFGLEHPRAHRTVNTLREPMYRRIAEEKGVAVPSLPDGNNTADQAAPAESPIYI